MPGSAEYCAFLERATAETLDELDTHVHEDVRFKDPFNDTRGRAAMRGILAEMFDVVSDLRFRIHESMGQEPNLAIVWTLEGQLRGKPWRVEGASHLTFDENGMLIAHIDYWDAASSLYEQLPVIGWPLRAIRRRLQYQP